MDGRVEGDGGGIRGLRLLIEGEYAGAINTDLRAAGMPGVDWAGTLHLSWWELKEFILNSRQDSTSAYFRARNPQDHIWHDDHNLWFSKIASMLSEIRFLSAAGKFEDIPDDYLPVRYGPPDQEEIADPIVVPDKVDVMKSLEG